MRPWLLAVAAALLAASAARAEDARECRNGAFPREQDAFALARVTGPGRLAFLGDDGDCLSAATRCAGHGYVIAGDLVITGRSLGPYLCAFFPNRAGGTAGWVLRARLEPEPAPASIAASAWVGRWRDGDDGIRLTLRPGGVLRADGDAYWPSANPPLSQRPGGPNIGSLAAQGRPAAGRLHLSEAGDDDACRVDLWLVAPFLVARDNMNCGGMNVSFTGVYSR